MRLDRPWLWALLMLAFFFGVGVFDHDVWPPTEPTVAGIVWEMHAKGDLAVPRIDGREDLEKPPLAYWLSLAATSVFGLSAGAIRFPCTVLGFLALLSIVWIARRRYGTRVALVVGLVGATTAVFFELSHRACTDIVATFFVVLCFSLFSLTLDAPEMPKNRRILIDAFFALALALSFYAKNFYTFLIVVPPVAAYLVFRRQLRRGFFLAGITLVLLVAAAAPWCLQIFGEGRLRYVKIVFVDNVFGRFLHLSPPARVARNPLNDAYVVGRENDPFFYLEALGILVAPWLLLAGAGLARLFRRGERGDGELRRFLAIAIVSMLVLLTISSSKAAEYLTPALFVTLLASAGVLHDLFHRPQSARRYERWLTIANLALVGGILAAAPAAAAARLHEPLLYLATPAIGALLFALLGRRVGDWTTFRRTYRFLFAAVVLLGVALALAIPRVNEQKTFRHFFDAIHGEIRGRTVYSTFLDDRRLPVICYYLRREVPILQNPKAVIAKLHGTEKAAVIVNTGFGRRHRDELRGIRRIHAKKGRRTFLLLLN